MLACYLAIIYQVVCAFHCFSVPVPAKSKYVAPSREGKVGLTVFVEPKVRQDLKIAAAVHEMTVDALVQEGLEAVLRKYGKRK